MSITFYYAPRSTATRIHWALEELAVPYAKVKVDLAAGDQRKPDFLRLNPNGKVPCLVDESTPIFESHAILIHLGQKYGVERGLWPDPAGAAQGQALSWAVWGAATLAPVGYRQALAAEPQGENPELASLLHILDRRVAEAPYVLGDHFTLVDLANAAGLLFPTRRGLSLDPYPRVKEWFARVTARPALATATRE